MNCSNVTLTVVITICVVKRVRAVVDSIDVVNLGTVVYVIIVFGVGVEPTDRVIVGVWYLLV